MKENKSLIGRVNDNEPNPVDVHVGNRIRLRRTILHITQQQMAEMLGFVAVLTLLSNTAMTSNVDVLSSMMLKLAVALGIMAVVCKLVAKLTPEEMIKGTAFGIAFFTALWYIFCVSILPAQVFSLKAPRTGESFLYERGCSL